MLGVKCGCFHYDADTFQPKGGLGREEHGALRPALSLASCVILCKGFFSNAKW